MVVVEVLIKKQERGIPDPCFSSRLIFVTRDILQQLITVPQIINIRQIHLILFCLLHVEQQVLFCRSLLPFLNGNRVCFFFFCLTAGMFFSFDYIYNCLFSFVYLYLRGAKLDKIIKSTNYMRQKIIFASIIDVNFLYDLKNKK